MNFRNINTIVLFASLTAVVPSHAEEWQDRMYTALGKDLKALRNGLEPYLSTMYTNTLDYHNMLRANDFSAAYLYVVHASERLEASLATVAASADRLKVSSASTVLKNRAEFGRELNGHDEMLRQLLVETSRVAAMASSILVSWQNRADQTVISYMATQYDFKSLYHQPVIAASDAYDSYAFGLTASYIPMGSGFSVTEARLETKQSLGEAVFNVTKSGAVAYYSQGDADKEENGNLLVALAKLAGDIFFGIRNMSAHEAKVKNLISKEVKVVSSTRKQIASKQNELISESIQRVLTDADNGSGTIEDRLSQIVQRLLAFQDYFQSKREDLRKKYQDNLRDFELGLGDLQTVNGDAIISRLNAARTSDMRSVADTDREVKPFAYKFKNDLRLVMKMDEGFSRINEQKRLLKALILKDSANQAKYRFNKVYTEDRNYFFNESRKTLIEKTPNGEWLSVVLNFLEGFSL